MENVADASISGRDPACDNARVGRSGDADAEWNPDNRAAQATVPTGTLKERWDEALVGNYGTPRLEFVEGQGAWVTDADGNRYLDLLAGIAVNALGHAHPQVVQAVATQVGRLAHTSNLYAHPQGLRLAARLQQKTGGHKALLVNSGAEANEAALKLVRKKAYADGRGDGVVIAFDQGFHGRTYGALSLTGQPKYHEGFAPLVGNIVHVPFNDTAALEAAFAKHDVVGVFAEYLQGEGGVKPMTAQFAKTLHAQADVADAIVVADEVQTGVARTGRFFAYEHFDVKPDVVTMAKGLGGGMPIGACLMRPELAALLTAGTHGTTFGGNPVACAAANAVLDVVDAQHLAERAERLGDVLTKAFTTELAEGGIVPRGMGLLQGLPLNGNVAGKVVERLEAEGVVVGVAGQDVVRLAPPLIVDEDDLTNAVPAIAKAIRAVGSA